MVLSTTAALYGDVHGPRGIRVDPGFRCIVFSESGMDQGPGSSVSQVGCCHGEHLDWHTSLTRST